MAEGGDAGSAPLDSRMQAMGTDYALVLISEAVGRAGGWLLWLMLGIAFAAVASTAGLSRWSSSIYIWPVRRVGITLVIVLVSLLLTVLWFVCGTIVGGPVTALAVLFWPEDAPELRDFDFTFISVMAANGIIGMVLNFCLFPLAYWAVTASKLPSFVRYASVPVLVLPVILSVMLTRNTLPGVLHNLAVIIMFVASIAALWLSYIVSLDALSDPGKP